MALLAQCGVQLFQLPVCFLQHSVLHFNAAHDQGVAYVHDAAPYQNAAGQGSDRNFSLFRQMKALAEQCVEQYEQGTDNLHRICYYGKPGYFAHSLSFGFRFAHGT